MEKIDHIPKGYRKFYLRAAGKIYIAPEKCCLFCKHCDDIVWDYTNGPYMVHCDKEMDYNKGFAGKCCKFRYRGDYV